LLTRCSFRYNPGWVSVLRTVAARWRELDAREYPFIRNVVVAVNVAKLLDSPYAKQHQWAENMAEKWQTRLLGKMKKNLILL